MAGPFEGVRVVEVAAWTFVPGAGAIMADLGADVIKVEPPTGDPQRALRNALNADDSAPNPFLQVPNRGKRSITLDLTTPAGLDALRRLVKTADVFLTSYLPKVRAKLGIDPEDLREENPRLVYVRGSGWGSQGANASTGGFDSAAAWSAAGVQNKLTAPGAAEPAAQPAAFFDLQGSSAIAGAVAMALFRRERSGEGAVIDVSLLNTGMWTMGPDLAAAATGSGELPRIDRKAAPNPIVNYYRTSDDRWLNLVCLQADRFWAELCTLIGRDDLIDDERFRDAFSRYVNSADCVAELDATFGSRTLDEWRTVLANFSGVWSAAATFEEVCASPQVADNGYLPEVVGADGRPFRLVAPPYQFDGVPTTPAGPAPELGQHTEEILLDAGLDWDTIADLREQGALG
ncbi:CoA transferase [Mycolicibacterium moriokaense]|uniref:CoA transferase n=1 Tax=Mycolicibacterium moriokaense TaxID=39691 RepID=A0AAD1M5T4_9MYCO|nr:CoA transferase [Mycolicibacterium moriokaense]MCV7039660.1 CoA transferase [Mycolicibacterium moriokaense]ORB19926.1 CoA transferase [Mycolicibacterium moriokaense]BBX01892.1 CoA transferase [Mycolicibacterium moriokaense]